MAEYYCHECIRTASLANLASPANLTGTQYQLDKFIKHHLPTASYPLNSVFSSPTIQTYSAYIVNASASGCLEIDD